VVCLTLLAIGSFSRKRGTSVLFIVVGWAHVCMYRVSTIVFLWMYSIESHGVCSLICHLVISGNSKSVGDDVFGTFVLLIGSHVHLLIAVHEICIYGEATQLSSIWCACLKWVCAAVSTPALVPSSVSFTWLYLYWFFAHDSKTFRV
jgi:hypothetical protein